MKLHIASVVLMASDVATANSRTHSDPLPYKRTAEPVLQRGYRDDGSSSNWEATKRQSKRLTPVNAVLPTASDDPVAVASMNPYSAAPYTGVVRSYDFTISRTTHSPDGTSKSMLLINDAFPGPLITANWGDTIQVTVHNNITGPQEGTALHWHGFLQSTSQWADGVPGISECPIAPGRTRTYSFQAQLYGTSWYHSHFSSQYADGLVGPIVINGPSQLPYDHDLGPVMLQDLYHANYFSIVEDIMGTDTTKVRPSSDNNLINGLGCPPSTGDLPDSSCTNLNAFQVEKGKRYRMRLINSSAAAIQKFSIDGHNMTVIAYDFVAIQPVTASVITLGVAQRADIVLEATGDSNTSYWIRTRMPSGSCTEPGNSRNAWAVLHYENASHDALPSTIAHTDTTPLCENDPLTETRPMFDITPGTPDIVENIDLGVGTNETGHIVWTLGNKSFRTNYNHPPLLLAKNGNTSYPFDPQWNIHEANSSGSIRVVVNNTTPTSHPMHLHGHNMYILAAGTGDWNGTIVNPENPMRRDVHLLPAHGHLVLQWDLDNPGVWPFHCHIAWHVSGGLQITYMERPDDIRRLNVPQTKWGECNAWEAYTNTTIVDMIDSGL